MLRELALIFAFASVVFIFDSTSSDYQLDCDPAFFQGIQTPDVLRCSGALERANRITQHATQQVNTVTHQTNQQSALAN